MADDRRDGAGRRTPERAADAAKGRGNAPNNVSEARKSDILARRARNYEGFKMGAICAAVLVFFAVFCYKILYEQNVNGEEYHRRALTQLMNQLSVDSDIIANRGMITDRNMQPLASSNIVYNAYLDVRILHDLDKSEKAADEESEDEPGLLSLITSAIKGLFSGGGDASEESETIYTLDVTAEAINDVFGIAEDEVWGWLATNPETGALVNDTNYYVFMKDVSYDTMKAYEAWSGLEENKGKTPRCVYFEESTKRNYTYNTLAASVIGFTRWEDTWGLESRYGSLLEGENGRIFRYIDSSGDIATERVEAVQGATLVTTLDLSLQQFAEELVVSYGEEYEAENCAVIVMNPNSGEVLVMAQYPTFNLNSPEDLTQVTDMSYAASAELERSEKISIWDDLWKNFCLTYTFEPGSIFKPVTVAAALEEGIITENSTFYCSGSKTVAGYGIKCTAAHGAQVLEEAIANSCNVAMMNIAEMTGRDIFYKYQREFGYGIRTGIDLPFEGVGVMFSLSDLNESELATSSFGQRFNCTPIQAIASFCAIINGGNYMTPYVVSKAVDAEGNVLLDNNAKVERQVISEEVSDYLREAMEKVITEGTGKKAAISGYSIGGKSGTGEQGVKGTDGYAYSLSFIGYFPVEDPQYVALVTINRVPQDVYDSGKKTAAPMFKEMAAEIIRYKGIQPSYDAEGGSGMTSSLLELSNYSGRSIVSVTEELNRLGLEYEILGGSGSTVTKQYPEAGTKLSSSGVLYLTIGGAEAELITVPDVLDIDPDSAGALLSAAGFVARTYTEVSVSGEAASEGAEATGGATEASERLAVYKQVPDAGVKVPAGTEVRLEAR